MEHDPDTPVFDPASLENASAPIDRDAYCQECGYNLRGLTDDQCPECGTSFNRFLLGVPDIPWLRRGSTWAFRAYWQTVELVIADPRGFCNRLLGNAGFVSPRAGRQFRWISIILATICGARFFATFIRGSFVRHDVAWIITTTIGSFVFCILTTECRFYGEGFKADLVHDYYSAGLAIAPIYPFVSWTAMWLHSSDLALLLILPVLSVHALLWWHSSTVMYRQATRCSAWRAAAFGLFLPVAWVGCAILCSFLMSMLMRWLQ